MKTVYLLWSALVVAQTANAFTCSPSPTLRKWPTTKAAILSSPLRASNDNVSHNQPSSDKDATDVTDVTDVTDATAALTKKIQGRKKRVILGYKATIAAYLALAASFIVKSGIKPQNLQVMGGNTIMPMGVSYILISAAENDRLSSDTYKRLNLSLLEYGLIGVLNVALIPGRRTIPVLYLPFALSVINSVKGYSYGVLGWGKNKTDVSLLGDLWEGTKNTIQGFVSLPKNLKSMGYQAAMTMVAVLKLSTLVEIVKFIQANSSVAGFYPLPWRFVRSAFLTMILYTLKDAADRDRLGGTTFIELNYLAALVLGVHAFAYWGGVMSPLGGAGAAFSLFCAWNGLSSYMGKAKKSS